MSIQKEVIFDNYKVYVFALEDPNGVNEYRIETYIPILKNNRLPPIFQSPQVPWPNNETTHYTEWRREKFMRWATKGTGDPNKLIDDKIEQLSNIVKHNQECFSRQTNHTYTYTLAKDILPVKIFTKTSFYPDEDKWGGHITILIPRDDNYHVTHIAEKIPISRYFANSNFQIAHQVLDKNWGAPPKDLINSGDMLEQYLCATYFVHSQKDLISITEEVDKNVQEIKEKLQKNLNYNQLVFEFENTIANTFNIATNLNVAVTREFEYDPYRSEWHVYFKYVLPTDKNGRLHHLLVDPNQYIGTRKAHCEFALIPDIGQFVSGDRVVLFDYAVMDRWAKTLEQNQAQAFFNSIKNETDKTVNSDIQKLNRVYEKNIKEEAR